MAYYTLKKVDPMPTGGITTAAMRTCAICDHVIEAMGGPGDGSVCEECATLIRRGQIKIDRADVVKAAAEDHHTGR